MKKNAAEFIEEQIEKDNKAIESRGKIITLFLKIEDSIDELIAEHYCHEAKQRSFFEIEVICHIPTRKKLIILKILSKKLLNNKHKKLLDKIGIMTDIRNKIAHGKPITLTGKLYNTKTYDLEDIQEIEKKFLSLYYPVYYGLGDMMEDLRKMK